jgi:hypothetical protein
MTRWLAILPLLAWLAAWMLRPLTPYLAQHVNKSAILPLVSSDARGDVASNVAALMIVLAWALACALLMEPAKFRAPTHFAGHGLLGYAVLLAYQGVLTVETVRVQLPDWWIWFNRVLHLRLSTAVADPLVTQRVAFPWVSLLCAVAVAAAWWFGQSRVYAERN